MDVVANGTAQTLQPLNQALSHFLSNNEVGMVSVSLTAIINIIKNVLSNPKDMKLRTLQKSNKNILYKITHPPGCRELMTAMGWVSSNDAYVLPMQVPIASLTETKTRLEAQLEAAEKVISTPRFLPNDDAPRDPILVLAAIILMNKHEIPRLQCHMPKELDLAVPLVGSARFEVCVGSTMGRRPTMEDEVVVVGMGPAHNPDEDFFGVFDGHGGRDAAIYAAKNLYPKIGRNFTLNPNEPLKSITNAFEETNAWMMQQRMGCGSTAAVSFVVGSTLYTANVGDTRVVLGWKDRKAVRLSFDHKPSVATEKERIERLGGEVTKKYGVARVNGVLGVSRAFGDCKLVPYVSAVPHINMLELTDETMFLIIACDGLWDEFSDQEAVELVFEKASTVQNMGEYLSNMAIMRGSQDNVSVVVVFLNPRSALYEEEEEEDDEEDEEDEEDDEDDFRNSHDPLPVFDEGSDSEEDEEGEDLPRLSSVPPPSSSSISSTSRMMSRAIISSGGSNSSSDFVAARPSLRAMIVQEEEDSSSSDEEDQATAGGLGVGSLSAWVEEDDED